MIADVRHIAAVPVIADVWHVTAVQMIADVWHLTAVQVIADVWHLTSVRVVADVEAAGLPAAKAEGSGWILTTCIMVAEMFGLGILTLPADFARLGWAVGLSIVLLFCLGMIYSGVLFAQLGKKLPNARVYEDLATASLGKHGKWVVYCTVYLVIFLDPIIFHLTAAQSLQQIFYEKNVPMWVASLTVSVIMLPLSQIQHIGEVSLISIVGTIGMLTAVVIATLKLLMMEGKPVEHETMHSGGFNIAVVALMDIVFTFGGKSRCQRCLTWPSVPGHSLTQSAAAHVPGMPTVVANCSAAGMHCPNSHSLVKLSCTDACLNQRHAFARCKVQPDMHVGVSWSRQELLSTG